MVFTIHKMRTTSNVTPSPSQTLKETKRLLEALPLSAQPTPLECIPVESTRVPEAVTPIHAEQLHLDFWPNPWFLLGDQRDEWL